MAWAMLRSANRGKTGGDQFENQHFQEIPAISCAVAVRSGADAHDPGTGIRRGIRNGQSEPDRESPFLLLQ